MGDEKYFIQKELRHYCFSVKQKLGKGTFAGRDLFKASDKAIIRHIKIKKDANPFDPAYEEYFETRKSATMINSSTGMKTVMALLREQSNKCSCCGEHISMMSKWVIHLLTSRLKGGDYNNSNLCVIHNKCHRKGFETGFVYKLPVTPNGCG